MSPVLLSGLKGLRMAVKGEYLRVRRAERTDRLRAILVPAGRQFGSSSGRRVETKRRHHTSHHTLDVSSHTDTPTVGCDNHKSYQTLTLIAIYDRKKSVHSQLTFLPSSAIDITARWQARHLIIWVCDWWTNSIQSPNLQVRTPNLLLSLLRSGKQHTVIVVLHDKQSQLVITDISD
jgi:hypothetical protein